ncbi:hypothetical protein PUN4_230110 [Paraburkholderia unamae]|nr:hypothetical protein PUN4_230110 [Paraburkholderia unamae]
MSGARASARSQIPTHKPTSHRSPVPQLFLRRSLRHRVGMGMTVAIDALVSAEFVPADFPARAILTDINRLTGIIVRFSPIWQKWHQRIC